jgi:hypothetical protein
VPTPDFSGDTPMSLHDLQSTPGLNLLDLELLHNYITSTANTLNADPAMKTLWKINVRLALLTAVIFTARPPPPSQAEHLHHALLLYWLEKEVR